jgi:hypothetical protein
MVWSEFNLNEGRLRAIGDRRSFSTLLVRGMGLVVEYSTTKHDFYPGPYHRIPTTDADRVWSPYSYLIDLAHIK